MIPGGWFIPAPDGLAVVQHWRYHGRIDSVCGKPTLPHHHGSLLPKDDVPLCPTCLRIFREAARPHLAHYKAIVAKLETLL